MNLPTSSFFGAELGTTLSMHYKSSSLLLPGLSVVVHVGDGVDSNALNKLASVPVEENTHKITSYDQLIDIAQEVAYDVCQVKSSYTSGELPVDRSLHLCSG